MILGYSGIEINKICKLLTKNENSWAWKLEPFIDLANKIEPVADWTEALKVCVLASEQGMINAIRDLLQNGLLTLEKINAALDVNDYLSIIKHANQSTDSVNRIIDLLDINNEVDPKEYFWILKHSPIDHLYDLACSKRKLLRAIYKILRQDEAYFIQEVQDQTDLTIFWMFAILQNACENYGYEEKVEKVANNVSAMFVRSLPNSLFYRASCYAKIIDEKNTSKYLKDIKISLRSFQMNQDNAVRYSSENSFMAYEKISIPNAWLSHKSMRYHTGYF